MTIIIDAPSTSGGGYTDVSCRVIKSSPQSVGIIGNWNTVSWNSESYDTDGYHDNATNNSRLTIPSGKGGKHLVIVNIRTDQLNTQDQGVLMVNGGTAVAFNNNQAVHRGISLSAEYNFNAGDYIEYRHSPGQTSCNILTTSNFSIRKMS